jgi:diadenosine tetraphosphatase ApaH/serine/threonine PP2A family protein phosphatase
VRRLILSDIHSNLEALEAVLADARKAYDEVVCCGDVVGYGASPNETAEWVRRHAAAVVRGNHDRACAGLDDMDDFSDPAREAALWTRTQLTAGARAWLAGLPAGPLRFPHFEAVHGSPAGEDEYLVSDFEVYDALGYLERPLCFIGHTHLQGLWSFRLDDLREGPRVAAGRRERSFVLDPAAVYVVNPGSVGQPRDDDPRAAYALWDEETGVLRLRRVAYDVALAQKKIRQAGLPGSLAARLAAGR